MSGGKFRASCAMSFFAPFAASMGVGIGQLINRQQRGGLSVKASFDGVSLRAQFNARHVPSAAPTRRWHPPAGRCRQILPRFAGGLGRERQR